MLALKQLHGKIRPTSSLVLGVWEAIHAGSRRVGVWSLGKLQRAVNVTMESSPFKF